MNIKKEAPFRTGGNLFKIYGIKEISSVLKRYGTKEVILSSPED
jgi:hypothetical protein